MSRVLTYIPSPSQGVFHIGPLPIRMYAVCIILGVIAAVWIGNRRVVARGGPDGALADIATVAVPVGLVGARIYHVVTSPGPYFGKGGHPIEALYIWRGGLGIWGGVLAGCLAGWWMCRRRGLRFASIGDAAAPGIVVAQAIGRFGNYFNQELFGRPTHLPWGLRIDPGRDGTVPGAVAYHPTFLYESLWDLGVFALLVWADRRFRLGGGRVLALYVAAYTVGRGWIEALRIDTATHILGLRLNDWTSIIVFTAAAVFLLRTRGRERQPVMLDRTPAPAEDPAPDVA